MSEALVFNICGEHVETSQSLIEKYNRPGPRYTSYPTVPVWNEQFSAADYQQAISTRDSQRPLSLYFHLPFCQSLCLFCGCTTVINKNQSVSIPYLERLKREIDGLAGQLPYQSPVEQ